MINNEIPEVIKQFTDNINKPSGEVEGGFIDPSYHTVPINCYDICSQQVNPNYMSSQTFQGLLTSITNNGMVFPIYIAENPMYDPATKDDPIPLVYSGGQDTVDVRDVELRRHFKYTVVDGTHRLLAVLYGSPLYRDLPGIPKECVALYERTGGYVPCTIVRDKSSSELMSAEILFNACRGEHQLDSMKEIVSDLIRSGMSEQWISKNLFISPETIRRYTQLSGMRAAFGNTEALEKNAWDPIKDLANEKRKKIDLYTAARRWCKRLRQLQGKSAVFSDTTDVLAAAKASGFDEQNPGLMPKSIDTDGTVFETGYDDDTEGNNDNNNE